MKRLLLMMVTIATLASCQKTPEEKAEVLINDAVKKVLLHPEAYESVETKIDSAFTPFDDPEFYDKTHKLIVYGQEAEKAERKIKSAKSSMAIWSGPYQSAFGKTQYQEAKEELDAAEETAARVNEKMQELAEELKQTVQKEPEFIGFKARHKFRTANNAGDAVFGEFKFIFDKEVTKVITHYDMGDEEYLAVRALYAMMTGEDFVEPNE